MVFLAAENENQQLKDFFRRWGQSQQLRILYIESYAYRCFRSDSKHFFILIRNFVRKQQVWEKKKLKETVRWWWSGKNNRFGFL